MSLLTLLPYQSGIIFKTDFGRSMIVLKPWKPLLTWPNLLGHSAFLRAYDVMILWEDCRQTLFSLSHSWNIDKQKMYVIKKSELSTKVLRRRLFLHTLNKILRDTTLHRDPYLLIQKYCWITRPIYNSMTFDWWQMFSVYSTFLYMLVPYVNITNIALYESYEKFAEIQLFNIFAHFRVKMNIFSLIIT